MTHLVFTDLETGGLNGRLENGELGCEYYPIFEVAIIVTDKDLNEIGKPLCIAIYQDESEISKSHEKALEMHVKSGLLTEVRESAYSLKEAESLILKYLEDLGVGKYDRKAQTGGILAGNSIGFDRSFIASQMPAFNDYLHYRQIDISSLNLMARLWQPDLAIEAVAHKEYFHKALTDIRESVKELHKYKDVLF